MKPRRGATLVVTLMGLAIMMVMAVSLLHSTDTTTTVVGNTASKQAAAAVADTAVNAAAVWLDARTDMDSDAPGIYFAFQQTADAYGLPAVDWSGVTAAQIGNFRVQHLIDRLCDGTSPPTPVLDTEAERRCARPPASGSAASQRAGAPGYTRKSPAYYRVTVRIVGPRSSESYVQAVLSK